MEQKKALTNYYARLIAKDRYNIADVPEEIRADVQKQVSVEVEKLELKQSNQEL